MGLFDWLDGITSVINQTIAPTGKQIGSVEDKLVNHNAGSENKIVDITQGISNVISGSDQPTTIIPSNDNKLENEIINTTTEGTLADKIMTETPLEGLVNESEMKTPEEIKEEKGDNNNDININEILENARKYAEENQKKLWEREDAIRKETQQREDTAYQRAIEDMRKAGINPNLVGITPSASGGGITQASKKEDTATAEINNSFDMILNAINNDKDIKENTKDRLTDIVTTAFQIYAMTRFLKK